MRKSLFETLVDLLGRESAEQLVAEFGGARIWVPVRCEPSAQLAQVIGADAAAKLCQSFGGDYMQIPNTIVRHNVQGRIIELHRQGLSINQIALTVGRSRRTVFRLLGRKISDIRRSSLTESEPPLDARSSDRIAVGSR